MNQRKLEKLRGVLASMRRSPQKARDLEKVAEQLGRRKVKRGKEPVWESSQFAELFPLAIPHHGGRDLAPGTRNSILTQLDDDLLAWEELLKERDDGDEEDEEG